MSQVSGVLRKVEGGFAHWCPGCEEMHFIPTDAPNGSGARWQFDGNVDQPTFAPSILIRSGHYVPGQEGKDCWCSYEKRMGEPQPFSCGVCHYFIRGGQIEFCGDSTHALSGKTVNLPDLPADCVD